MKIVERGGRLSRTLPSCTMGRIISGRCGHRGLRGRSKFGGRAGRVAHPYTPLNRILCRAGPVCPAACLAPHSLSCHCEPSRRLVWQSVLCLRRGTFCQQRQKVPKERRQNQGFGILCAYRREVDAKFSLAQSDFTNFLCFRMVSASLFAPRSCGGTGMLSAPTVAAGCPHPAAR